MMQNLPNLSQISHTQKDALIVALWPLQQQLPALMVQVAAMQERLKQLEGRLALNSKNSSKPPTSAVLNKPVPKSVRVAWKKPTDGQKDHPGHTLRQACHCELPFAYVSEICQVFNLPEVKYEVTEHQVMQAICKCRQMYTAALAQQGQAWAGDINEVLQYANHQNNVNCAQDNTPNYDSNKFQREVGDLRAPVDAILGQAQAENPFEVASGKRGRSKQSEVNNLIDRLRDYADDVWRFMTQPDVPFTNNLAEQTVRMPKVKQKVSSLPAIFYAQILLSMSEALVKSMSNAINFDTYT